MTAVKHIAEALAKVLKVQRFVGGHRFLLFQERKHVDGLVEIKLRKFDDGDTFGHLRNIVLHILLHEFADTHILFRCPSCLADGSVVVVGCEVGLYVGLVVVVRTSPEPEVRTAMHHIEIEVDAIVEILLRLAYGVLCRYAHERFVPMIEPSRIEFRHHVRSLAAVVGIDHLLQVFHIVLAVGGRQCSLNGSAFEKP